MIATQSITCRCLINKGDIKITLYLDITALNIYNTSINRICLTDKNLKSETSLQVNNNALINLD